MLALISLADVLAQRLHGLERDLLDAAEHHILRHLDAQAVEADCAIMVVVERERRERWRV